MYKLFLDLDDFLAACTQAKAAIAIQAVQKTIPHTIPYVEAALMLTAAVPQPTAGTPQVLAARIPIEETQMWPDDHAAHTALTQRTQQADTLLRAACTAEGVPIDPHDGILAAPGLLTDLRTISTSQEIWRIRRATPNNSADWTLHPYPQVPRA